TMIGGAANDHYIVDNPGDVVIEKLGEGNNDSVSASISYALTDNVEKLTLMQGAGAINGTGNGLDNDIIGNDSNNVLTGGDGDDTAVFSQSLDQYTVQDGGAGNDDSGGITVTGPDGKDVLYNVEHLQFADGTIDLVDGNPLFDTAYYMSHNLDVFHAHL